MAKACLQNVTASLPDSWVAKKGLAMCVWREEDSAGKAHAKATQPLPLLGCWSRSYGLTDTEQYKCKHCAQCMEPWAHRNCAHSMRKAAAECCSECGFWDDKNRSE
mmetsp:Transcript_9385/g.25320  ORF Transcript_9385/g.25320 Transcript_9385/m.25320 type:complete len:106 (-) Transcript_9385:29-346(-)